MKDSFLKNTLMDLLNIESFSGNEKPVFDYVTPLLQSFGFNVEYDNMGNLYAVRGKSNNYPLLNAHMDSVEGYKKRTITYYSEATRKGCDKCVYGYKEGSQHVCAITEKDVEKWNAWQCKDYLDRSLIDDETEEKAEEPEEKFILKYDEKTKKLTSNETRPMGGDDKCGIAVALDIAKSTKIPMKILFTVEEETGCNGAGYVLKNHSDWLKDVAYGVTIDRRDKNHICVTTGNERNAGNYFIGELAKWAIISGIFPKFEKGSMSDNFYLKNAVPNFINISAGYYNAHRNSEYIQVDELKKIKNWVKNFLLKGNIK